MFYLLKDLKKLKMPTAILKTFSNDFIKNKLLPFILDSQNACAISTITILTNFCNERKERKRKSYSKFI